MGTLIHQSKDIAGWVKLYTTTGKLPQLKVGCTTCQNFTTLFGDNLISRVTKYGGDIKVLLTTFRCRHCMADVPKDAPIKAKKVSTKPRKKRTDTKEARVEALMTIGEGMVHKYNPVTVDMVKSATVCAEITKDNCWRPDIYLNNGKACDGCVLFTNCACTFKKLKK